MMEKDVKECEEDSIGTYGKLIQILLSIWKKKRFPSDGPRW